MKILIADTYYPGFIASEPACGGTYDKSLAAILYRSFGTGDFYGRNLRECGWTVIDVIYNHTALQQIWADEHGCSGDIFQAQVAYHRPDVVFLQDLSIPIPAGNFMLAAQCSCPMIDRDLSAFSVVFTSFPHYVERIDRLGSTAVFNPLGFDPIVLQRTDEPEARNLDVSFVGGVGAPSHWQAGMEFLETIAAEIPETKFWGYGYELLPVSSPVRQRFNGPAWGLDMYSILRRSKIVINRHGEVAAGYMNNMRCFEATGCGALLVTEQSRNLSDYFSDGEVCAYSSPAEAVAKIRHYLDHPAQCEAIAAAGQRRTLAEHTYRHRMQTISETLSEMLCHA